jgi:hypothetical protein
MQGGTKMADKDSVGRLTRVVEAALGEEQRCRKVWIEHVNALYVAEGAEEVTDETAYITARYILQEHKRGTLREAHEDTPKHAQALFDAVERRQDAWEVLTVEYAISYPDHLDELNGP